MKTSSAKNPDLKTAQGCCATNLVLPGLGSIIGGQKSGYPQLTLCLAGFTLTMAGGIRFITWSLAHWKEFQDPNADPATALENTKHILYYFCWPFLGMVIFAAAWVWSFFTSRKMLAQAKNLSS
jgi:hypothetical protein